MWTSKLILKTKTKTKKPLIYFGEFHGLNCRAINKVIILRAYYMLGAILNTWQMLAFTVITKWLAYEESTIIMLFYRWENTVKIRNLSKWWGWSRPNRLQTPSLIKSHGYITALDHRKTKVTIYKRSYPSEAISDTYLRNNLKPSKSKKCWKSFDSPKW